VTDRTEPAHMAMMKLADDHNDPPPPLRDDVDYHIGLDDGRLHAIRHTEAAMAVQEAGPAEWMVTARSVCNRTVRIARGFGEYDRGNESLRIHGACPECEWEAAIESGTTVTVIKAMRLTGADRDAATKAFGDPDLACRLYAAILCGDDYDQDHPHVLQLLAHATRHAPVLLVSEECGEGDCEHEEPAGCYENPVFACEACSVVAGSWAGSWEGQFARECQVPAPCSAFTALLTHYGIRPAGRPGDPAEPRLAAGMLVRQVLVEWAKEQSRPKLSWLLPWDRLDPGQQEVAMRIGEALWSAGRAVGLQEAALLANPLLDRP
jgi:hypothetical protein